MPRSDARGASQLRPLTFEPNIAPYASGSVLIGFGSTRVICAATTEAKVPSWMKQQGVKGGWLTAEYSMLPYSTLDRKPRDISKGKIDGRTVEIQRLIGRSLRAVLDLQKLGEHTLWIDCDVLQADGGTRTAAITGGYVALHQAFRHLMKVKAIHTLPLIDSVAAVSCGIFDGETVLDLEYSEDVAAQADANFVLTGNGGIVEIQGTAEERPFSEAQFFELLTLARKGVAELTALQKKAIES